MRNLHESDLEMFVRRLTSVLSRHCLSLGVASGLPFLALAEIEDPNKFQNKNLEEQWQCLKQNISTIADTMGPPGEFLTGLSNWIDKSQLGPGIADLDNQRVREVVAAGVGTANAGGPLYELRIGPNGEKTHVFRMMRQMTKHWNDREKMTELVGQVCNAFDPRVADFCVDSFWKKLDNISAFLKNHEEKIIELSENPPTQSETWMEKVGSYVFEADSITDSNLKFGGSAFIGESMMEHTAVPTPFGVISVPVEVRDGEGRVVGSLMPITTDDEPEYYFAETVSSNPINGATFRNPFYFIFGTDNAQDWNDRFESHHGGLFVGSEPLKDWIRRQKQSS